MTREKALQCMDRLNEAGYRVKVLAVPKDDRFVHLYADVDGRVFSVDVVELGVDKTDLRALVKIADELDLDCGTHAALREGVIHFTDRDPRPEVIRSQRRHPL